MKLYKFRPLDDEKSYSRITENINGIFWFSKFWNLNDVFEGYFTLEKSDNYKKVINKIFDQKNTYYICSFSGEKGFRNPLMRSHYTAGFKGIVLEIEFDKTTLTSCSVTYGDEYPLSDDVKKILTSKSKERTYEDEYRIFFQDNDGIGKGCNKYVGKVTKIFFGNPYRILTVGNDGVRENLDFKDYMKEYVERSENLKKYLKEFNKGKPDTDKIDYENYVPDKYGVF